MATIFPVSSVLANNEGLEKSDVVNSQRIECDLDKFRENTSKNFILPTDKNLGSDEIKDKVSASQSLAKSFVDRCKTEQGWTEKQYVAALLITRSQFEHERLKYAITNAGVSFAIADRVYKRLTDDDFGSLLNGTTTPNVELILVEEMLGGGLQMSTILNLVEGRTGQESKQIGRDLGSNIGRYVINLYMIEEFIKIFGSNTYKNSMLTDFFKKQGLDIDAL